MQVFHDILNTDLAAMLSQNAVGVLRTDTLYGIVAKAHSKLAVERIFKLKGRSDTKSPIVLIGSIEQMFDRPLGKATELLKEEWPEKTSIIFESSQAPEWITRGNSSVAYRIPADESLRLLLQQTGPLIAPSANPQGQPPAMSYNEAYRYFGDTIDFYVDGGAVSNNTPSRILKVSSDGQLEQLR